MYASNAPPALKPSLYFENPNDSNVDASNTALRLFSAKDNSKTLEGIFEQL